MKHSPLRMINHTISDNIGLTANCNATPSDKAHPRRHPVPTTDPRNYHPPKVLLATKNHQITYHKLRAKSQCIVISFGEIDSKLQPSGFASELCFRSETDHIYIAQRPQTQYQFLTAEDLFDAVNSVTKGKRIITYGSSLGAYCAIYYAGHLNANVLALSPRIPAHPAINAIMGYRFKNKGFKHKELVSCVRTQGKVHVFFDPNNYIDSFYVNNFLSPAYPNATYHQILGAGHYTARALALSGDLKTVAHSFFRNNDINYSVNHSALLKWQRKAVVRRLRRGQLQHATENLAAIITSPYLEEHQIFEYSRWFQRMKDSLLPELA